VGGSLEDLVIGEQVVAEALVGQGGVALRRETSRVAGEMLVDDGESLA